MAHGELAAFRSGELDDLAALPFGSRQRLFNEDVLAGFERGYRHRVMRSDRRTNDDCIHVRIR